MKLENKEITKLEEDQTFQILKLKVVPKAAEAYTNIFNLNRSYNKIITTSMILKNIKKMYKEVGKIYYESKIDDGVTIKFIMEKSIVPFVLEKYGRPIFYIGYYAPNEDRYLLYYTTWTSNLDLGYQIIKEEIKKPVLVVSKEDIHRVIQFLKKFFASKYPDLGKRIRKVGEHPPNLEGNSNRIHFEYNNGKIRIIFVISRNPEGLWISRYNEGDKTAVDDFNLDVHGDKCVNEETEEELLYKYGTPEVSKEEEYRALQFIKFALVPMAVEKGNKWIKENRAVFQLTTVQQVLKRLKKTVHKRGPVEGITHIEYEYTEYTDGKPHIPLRFMINKGKSQWDEPFKWHLMAGMEDPIATKNDFYIVQYDEKGKPII